MESARYTTVAIILHWVIALAIFGMIGVGWFMGDLANSNPLKETLYQAHKSVGITILVLVIARILWRVMNPPPKLPDDMAALEKTASHLVHLGFYGLMLLMPLTGWLYVSTAYDFDIATVLFGVVSWPDLPFTGWLSNETGHAIVEFIHSKLAWVAIGFLVLHVAGALKHEITAEEGVLKRMMPGLFGSTQPPRAARGTLIAFGTAIGAFAAIAAIPVLNQTGAGANLTGSGEVTANWQVDQGASSIRFSGLHEGSEFTGQFSSWNAEIAFDPEALDASRAEVAIDLSSANASERLYTETIRGPEWFAVAREATARVVVSDIARDERTADWGETYTATAAITLKGNTVEAAFPFQLEIDGDTARMLGTATLSRSELDLGMSSDPGAEWVADRVDVVVELTARRAGN